MVSMAWPDLFRLREHDLEWPLDWKSLPVFVLFSAHNNKEIGPAVLATARSIHQGRGPRFPCNDLTLGQQVVYVWNYNIALATFSEMEKATIFRSNLFPRYWNNILVKLRYDSTYILPKF